MERERQQRLSMTTPKGKVETTYSSQSTGQTIRNRERPQRDARKAQKVSSTEKYAQENHHKQSLANRKSRRSKRSNARNLDRSLASDRTPQRTSDVTKVVRPEPGLGVAEAGDGEGVRVAVVERSAARGHARDQREQEPARSAGGRRRGDRPAGHCRRFAERGCCVRSREGDGDFRRRGSGMKRRARRGFCY